MYIKYSFGVYNIIYMNFVFFGEISNLEARSEMKLFDWGLTLVTGDPPLLRCRAPARGLESCRSPRFPECYYQYARETCCA